MRSRRNERGFRKAGDLRADRLEMPAARARELRLATAWQAVAGEAIARRAPARGIRRGVLEVEVPDERWASTLRELIPRLAGRLSGAYPDLGVKKLRLILPGVAGKPRAVAVSPVDDGATSEETASPPEDPGQDEEQTPVELEERLSRLAERYLDRAQTRDQKP